MSLSCTVSEIQQDIGQKSTFERTSPLFGAPLGVTPLEFRLDFWHQKTIVHTLLYGIVSAILHLNILIQYCHVTDGQTHDDSIYLVNIASCGTKVFAQWHKLAMVELTRHHMWWSMCRDKKATE